MPNRRRPRVKITIPIVLLTVAGGLGALRTVSDAAPRAATGTPDPTALTRATFADPPASVRPKYRWWMPLAYTDDDELRSELDQIKAAGGGGAEVAPFGVDGTGNNTDPFLAQYGFGTPAWAAKVGTMLAGAKADGLGLDLTIGPRWPATVPTVTDVNSPAAAQQLVFTHEFDAGGSTRQGPLPTNFDVAPPAGAHTELVAALVAKCSDASCATQTSGTRLLDRATVKDVTSAVHDGTLTLRLPGGPSDRYAVMAFYRAPTGQSLSGYTPTGTNYVLDTLSTAGAKASTDFYDKSILTKDVRSLIRRMDDVHLFEDSLELGSTQKWTADMVARWTALRGYSPIAALPALAGAGDQGLNEQPYFDFGAGVGTRMRTDYRQTLSDLYIADRLDVLRDWTHRHGFGTRIQPYGTPIDLSEAAGHIDVPEGESLAFGQSTGDYSNVQDYKVVATGAHLAGKPVVSDECCAFSGQVWASTASTSSSTSNLEAVYRGLAGGVNQVVWHGFPYLTRGPAGAGSQEVWPGMSYGGNTSYSEAWGAKGNPTWSDYKAVNDNLARLQLVLRQGQPRFDVAVYWQDFGLNGTGTTGSGSDRVVPSDSAMARAGYTYEYLSPAQLSRKDAQYQDGALFGDSSAYHAVVLRNQTTMPVAAARSLLHLARQGMPVVVVGAPPSTTPGWGAHTRDDAHLRDVVADLLRQRSVVQVADDDARAVALGRLGVPAAAAHEDADPATASALLDVRRHTADTDYYYLYNQTNATAAQTVTLSGAGTPYRLNTWTGAITPITGYRAVPGGVQVPVTVGGNDTDVIALSSRHDKTFPAPAPSTPPAISTAAAPAPVPAGDWTLSVDRFTPGASDLPGDTAHTTVGPVTLHAGADGRLPAWSAITPANGYAADLSDVSGVGTYTTHVTLGDDWTGIRTADLDLGVPVDTVRVAVNGTDLPPLDQQDLHHVDVGHYLHTGDNTVTVRVASTLLNAVRVAPGTGASSRTRMDYGLFGPVRITAVAGDRPVLTAEPLAPTLPLADGAWNRADVRVANNSGRTTSITVRASTPDGVTASTPAAVSVPAGRFAVVPVELRDTGVASGTSTVAIEATGGNGTRASTQVTLTHSSDLAQNPSGTPYPRVVASPSQDRYPAPNAIDGSASTFYVSSGREPGTGAAPTNPIDYGVDLGASVDVSTVAVTGRGTYGPRDYAVQTSDDGTHWTTVAQVTDGPQAGSSTTVPRTRARYVRLHVTRSYDPTGANVQISELDVRGPVGG